MIGMRTQPGVTHIAHHLVRSQILCQRTGAVEVSLHASVERLEPALQHVGLIGRQVERNRTAASQQSMCAFGGGIHAMALKLRARHRRRHKLARSPTGTHTIKGLERQHGSQAQRIAAKDACHSVIHHEECTGITSRAAQSTKIGHAQAKPANGVNEPPQMRARGIKRSIKARGRGVKRCNRQLPHHSHVEGIKAVRKRIDKVIGKRN